MLDLLTLWIVYVPAPQQYVTSSSLEERHKTNAQLSLKMISAGHCAPENCLQRKTWVLPVLQDRSTVSVKPDVKTTHREKMPPRRPPSPANHWQQEPHVKQVHQALPYFSQRKYVAYLASAALHDRANFPKVSFSQQHLNLLFLTPVMQHKSQNLPMKKRVNMLGN